MKLHSFQNFFDNKEAVKYFKSKYDDISEPLMEYEIEYDGSLRLIREPRLLGVEKNGKWGWIDVNEHFVIPALYDYGFVLCYSGVVLLEKDGKYGALYTSDFSTVAFSFKYDHITAEKYNTFILTNSLGNCALARPGDDLLTGFNYLGFLKRQIQPHLLTYAKVGLLGIKYMGEIDLRDGREVSSRTVSSFSDLI